MEIKSNKSFKYYLLILFACFYMALSNHSLKVFHYFEVIKWLFLLGLFFFILIFMFSNNVFIEKLYPFCVFYIFVFFQVVAILVNSSAPFDSFVKISFIFLIYSSGAVLFASRVLNIEDLTSIILKLSVVVTVVSFILSFSSLGYRGDRLVGLSYNANGLVAYSVISFICFFRNMQSNSSGRLLQLIGIAVSVYVTIKTGSRSGLATILFLYIFLSFSKIDAKKITLMILASVLVMILVSYIDFSFRSFDLNNRKELFLSLLNTFYHNPILGVGLGTSNATDGLSTAESSYLSLLSTSGLVGTSIILFLILNTLFILFRQLQYDQANKASLSLFFSILLLSGTEAYLVGVGNVLSISFYMILGGISQYSNYRVNFD